MSVEMISKQSVEDTKKFVVDRINNQEGLSVEYFEIVDGNTLQSITDWNDSSYIVGCIAVFCGEVRLIDNIRYK
jgi:pantoate--beta-alanine ligase